MTLLSLSNIDQAYAYLDPIPFIANFNESLDEDGLEKSFRKTARDFEGVNGKLVISEKNELALDISSDYAEYRNIQADETTPAYEYMEPHPSILGGPVTKAYFIRRPSGRTSICLSFSHVLTDGYGLFLFMVCWASNARGEKAPKPICDRSILVSPESKEKITETPNNGLMKNSGLILVEKKEDIPNLYWDERILLRDSAEWRELNNVEGLSFNDMICARLWREAARDSRNKTSTFVCYVDIRRHVPSLGPLYFGNAVLVTSITKTVGDICSAKIEEVAYWIKEAVEKAPTKRELALKEIGMLRDYYGPDVFKRVITYTNDGIAVTNMSRAPIDALNFDRGIPVGIEVNLPKPRALWGIILPKGNDIKIMVTKSMPEEG